MRSKSMLCLLLGVVLIVSAYAWISNRERRPLPRWAEGVLYAGVPLELFAGYSLLAPQKARAMWQKWSFWQWFWLGLGLFMIATGVAGMWWARRKRA